MCGLSTTLDRASRGWSRGGGSTEKTSIPAPADGLAASHLASAISSTIEPRLVLMRIASRRISASSRSPTSPRVASDRHVERDIVRPRKQSVEIRRALYSTERKRLVGLARRQGQDVDTESLRHRRDALGNPAEPDQAESASRNFPGRGVELMRKVAFTRRAIGCGHMLCNGKKQSQGMFGDRLRVCVGSVRNKNASLGGEVERNSVGSDSMYGNHPKSIGVNYHFSPNTKVSGDYGIKVRRICRLRQGRLRGHSDGCHVMSL